MINFYRINGVAVLVSALVISAGCKRTDDLSHPGVQQAANTKKQSDTASADKPEKHPSAPTEPAKPSDDQKDKAEQAPTVSETKTEAKAKKGAATKNVKATDKAQTADPDKKVTAEQPSTEPTKGGVVAVPQTKYVRVDIPAGLQKLLNNDSRMQPWVSQVMKVANTCYANQLKSSDKAAGVIVIKITMHPNARPDAEILSLPPPLSGMVACATGSLMRTHMPLFTGPEGENYTLRIHFKR